MNADRSRPWAVCREIERMTGQTPIGLGDYLAIMKGHPNVRKLVLEYLFVGDRDELLAALGGDRQFDEALSRKHHWGGYEHAGRWCVAADFALLPGESVWVFGEDA